MDNNEDIINECAKEQIAIKKKTENLIEELNEKNKMINIVKNEYQKQVDSINDKYSQILKENALEIENLKIGKKLSKKGKKKTIKKIVICRI